MKEIKNMEIIPTGIEGCYEINNKRFGDERGFYESVTKEQLLALGFDSKDSICQISHSQNNNRGVLRGLHLQAEPYTQAKLVSCLSGAVYDVAVDVRKDSKTFGKWVGVALTPEKGNMLYIPRGCAHGFLSLKDNTLFEYFVDNIYAPSSEIGIPWNDETIGVEWPFIKYGIKKEDLITSEKDTKYSPFSSKTIYYGGNK